MKQFSCLSSKPIFNFTDGNFRLTYLECTASTKADSDELFLTEQIYHPLSLQTSHLSLPAVPQYQSVIPVSKNLRIISGGNRSVRIRKHRSLYHSTIGTELRGT